MGNIIEKNQFETPIPIQVQVINKIKNVYYDKSLYKKNKYYRPFIR